MTRTFRLTIHTDNSAFHDDESGAYAPAAELARILRRIATALEQDPDGPWHNAHAADGGLYQNVRDINGNLVGTYAVKADRS